MARVDEGWAAGVACGFDAPAIEVRGLSFTYPGAGAPVLDGLDWLVPQGAFALLVGGTGSGKSTLMSLLKPEIAPTGECTGELRVLGEAVADMGVRASVERVGYVFQDPENQIVCETVWHEMAFGLENLGTPRDEIRRRVAETSYFFGLEDWLHRDTDTLSGGRKQLLSLAAVLALRPRVLLLDEPTSQLDPVAACLLVECPARDDDASPAAFAVIDSQQQVQEQAHGIGVAVPFPFGEAAEQLEPSASGDAGVGARVLQRVPCPVLLGQCLLGQYLRCALYELCVLHVLFCVHGCVCLSG